MTIEVIAAANIDDVVVAWRTSGKVDGCLGFALERSSDGATPEVLKTGMPFAGLSPVPGTDEQPSDVWPIQRFVWTDHLAPADASLTYRVRPVFGSPTDPQPADDAGSEVSNAVRRYTGTSPGYSLFPNRGIVAAPWIEAEITAAKASGDDPTATDSTVLTALTEIPQFCSPKIPTSGRFRA